MINRLIARSLDSFEESQFLSVELTDGLGEFAVPEGSHLGDSLLDDLFKSLLFSLLLVLLELFHSFLFGAHIQSRWLGELSGQDG